MYAHMINYLCDRLNQLENEIETLKKENDKFHKKIEAIKPLHIEKMEYKIHELHVQTLSGTLNVGLTANADEQCMGEIIDKIVEEHRSNVIVEEEGEAEGEQSDQSDQ